MGEALKNDFFEDGGYPPRQILSNEDQPSPEGSSEDRQRRRRPRQTVANFPSFDDELKEGTQLHNQRTPALTDRRGQLLGPPERTTLTELGRKPKKESDSKDTDRRKIGSQFLELNGGFSLNVSSINEDIIALSRDDLKDAIRDAEVSNQRGLEEGKNPSADRIYVERQGKFYALSKRPEEWIETPVSDPTKTDLIARQHFSSSDQSIVSLYKASRHLFLFAHGLLAGISLFHCITVFYASPPRQTDWLLFLRLYVPVAVIFKTLYQALVAICCVSCLCRIDLMGGIDLQLLVKHLDSIVSTVLYFGAAALTHLCDITTVRLLHEVNTSSGVFSQDFLDEMGRWKLMDAVRTGCIGVGWLLLACRWKHDRTQIRLEHEAANALGT